MIPRDLLDELGITPDDIPDPEPIQPAPETPSRPVVFGTKKCACSNSLCTQPPGKGECLTASMLTRARACGWPPYVPTLGDKVQGESGWTDFMRLVTAPELDRIKAFLLTEDGSSRQPEQSDASAPPAHSTAASPPPGAPPAPERRRHALTLGGYRCACGLSACIGPTGASDSCEGRGLLDALLRLGFPPVALVIEGEHQWRELLDGADRPMFQQVVDLFSRLAGHGPLDGDFSLTAAQAEALARELRSLAAARADRAGTATSSTGGVAPDATPSSSTPPSSPPAPDAGPEPT